MTRAFLRALASSATALALLSGALRDARAERPVIDLNGARVQAFPLAVAPALGASAQAGAVMAVLTADFDRSGLFRLLDPKSFLADNAREGVSPTTINFSRWAAVGAQGLVKAVVAEEGETVTVAFHLYDPAKAAEVLHGTYSAPRAGLRQIAHRFADDVVRFFTQEPGDFQTRIAFVRETEEGKQLAVADSDGFGVQPLTGAAIHLLPAWAPDGRTLAFTGFRDGAAHVYTVDVLTRAIHPLVGMGDFATGASYAPGGGRIVFSASVADNTDVYSARADGTAVRRLTEARGIDISASWSPDGKQIAFISDRAGSPQVYVMEADGTRQRRITFQGNYNQEPAWSPKGDLIAFSGRDEHRSFDIYTVSVSTGKVARLTQNEGTNEKPAWSPNGRHLLFDSTRSGKRQIWQMTAEGQNPRQITSEKQGASDPSWGPLPQR
ncbi:MAG: Tol-Pal system beta propeller repeat protein TolB [Myxococcales bacterium]